jgi:hypothetical protein
MRSENPYDSVEIRGHAALVEDAGKVHRFSA